MPAEVVLQTWKQISQYVGRTERTLQRWEQEFGFPVHRPSGKSRSAVLALTQEINEWMRGKPSLVQIRQTTRINRDKLVPRSRLSLLKRLNSDRVEFLQAELALGLTMAKMATVNKGESLGLRAKNIGTARRAYETAVRFRDSVQTTALQGRELDRKLQQLDIMLSELGERLPKRLFAHLGNGTH